MALVVSIPGSSFDPLGPGNTGLCYIEVIVGTAEADAVGLVDGTVTFTDPALINRCVEVHRNGLIVPSIPWRSSQYITKIYAYSFFDFSYALEDGDLIKIKIL